MRPPTIPLWWSLWRFKFLFVFVLFETNTENEVYVRERHFHWWACDREVAREPESRCRALLPCPMAHARRHSRAVSCACATAAQTAKSFRALAKAAWLVGPRAIGRAQAPKPRIQTADCPIALGLELAMASGSGLSVFSSRAGAAVVDFTSRRRHATAHSQRTRAT